MIDKTVNIKKCSELEFRCARNYRESLCDQKLMVIIVNEERVKACKY